MISKRGDFFVLGMSDNTKGVHLSQVHQQSKKCTNREGVPSARLVQLRQLHPLGGCVWQPEIILPQMAQMHTDV